VGNRARFVALAALLAALVGALYLYDRARSDEIAEGVEVAGIDVGGMSVDDAAAAVGRRAIAQLRRPVVVTYRERRFVLPRTTARVEIHARASAEEALRRSRDGSFLSRGFRALAGRELDASITPRVTYSSAAVKEFVHKIEHAVERRPRDARVDFSGESVRIVEGRNGREVAVPALDRAVRSELQRLSGSGVVAVDAKVAKPRVRTNDLPSRYPWIITVHRPTFRLRVFHRLEHTKTYSVGIGQIGYTTPAGLYSIQNKAIDPVWNVPDEPWAGELRGRLIPPGPENPIKARWLGVYDGVGIHGTAETASIGTRASRGCIRMRIEEVKELYRRIPVGTAIYIE
jgi:lipoprotein-anchoring transpeptidase ErfK/SrfK